MAYKDPEQHRAYLRRRYQQRKEEALRRLGGACCSCGSPDELQVDHIRREDKTMPFSRMYVVSQKRFDQGGRVQLAGDLRNLRLLPLQEVPL